MMKITINMVIDDHYLAVHAQDDNSEHVDNDYDENSMLTRRTLNGANCS